MLAAHCELVGALDFWIALSCLAPPCWHPTVHTHCISLETVVWTMATPTPLQPPTHQHSNLQSFHSPSNETIFMRLMQSLLKLAGLSAAAHLGGSQVETRAAWKACQRGLNPSWARLARKCTLSLVATVKIADIRVRLACETLTAPSQVA